MVPEIHQLETHDGHHCREGEVWHRVIARRQGIGPVSTGWLGVILVLLKRFQHLLLQQAKRSGDQHDRLVFLHSLFAVRCEQPSYRFSLGGAR